MDRQKKQLSRYQKEFRSVLHHEVDNFPECITEIEESDVQPRIGICLEVSGDPQVRICGVNDHILFVRSVFKEVSNQVYDL